MDTARDAELVKRYKASKNQKFLQELFLSYQPYVYRQCMSILKHSQDSEDASIEVYIELKEKLLTHNVDNFGGWLYMLTRNLCLKKLRKKGKMLMQTLDEFEDKGEISENSDHIGERIEKLPDCIEQLKEEQRWCIVLFYLHGKSYKEIEALKGYDFKKIKSSIMHGKKNLLKLITAHEQ